MEPHVLKLKSTDSYFLHQNSLSLCSVFRTHGQVLLHHHSTKTFPQLRPTLLENSFLHFPQRRASFLRRCLQLPRREPPPVRVHPQPPREAGRLGLPPAHVHFPQRPIRPTLLPPLLQQILLPHPQ